MHQGRSLLHEKAPDLLQSHPICSKSGETHAWSTRDLLQFHPICSKSGKPTHDRHTICCSSTRFAANRGNPRTRFVAQCKKVTNRGKMQQIGEKIATNRGDTFCRNFHTICKCKSGQSRPQCKWRRQNRINETWENHKEVETTNSVNLFHDILIHEHTTTHTTTYFRATTHTSSPRQSIKLLYDNVELFLRHRSP